MILAEKFYVILTLLDSCKNSVFNVFNERFHYLVKHMSAHERTYIDSIHLLKLLDV